MDNTHEYVEKLKQQKEKQMKNYKTQGNDHPDKRKPNVKHHKD